MLIECGVVAEDNRKRKREQEKKKTESKSDQRKKMLFYWNVKKIMLLYMPKDKKTLF